MQNLSGTNGANFQQKPAADLLKVILKINSKYDKSAASFCRKVALFVPDRFCNFYLVKNYKIANALATTESRENKHRFVFLKI